LRALLVFACDDSHGGKYAALYRVGCVAGDDPSLRHRSDGKIVWQGRCLSTPEDIAGTIRAKASDVVRIGLESGPLSTWHWHALKAMGLPVVCLDSRHAQATMSGQVNKADKNDAYGLAQIVRAGWYREVGVKSLDSHTVRSMLGARAQLVGMRVEVTNQIRGILKTFRIVLPKRTGAPFEQLVAEARTDPDSILDHTVRSLISVYSWPTIFVAQNKTRCAENRPVGMTEGETGISFSKGQYVQV
jgi:transposase